MQFFFNIKLLTREIRCQAVITCFILLQLIALRLYQPLLSYTRRLMNTKSKNTLFSIETDELPSPTSRINTPDLFKLLPLEDNFAYEKELLNLSAKASLKETNSLSFDHEAFHNGHEGSFLIYQGHCLQYAYSERGSKDILANCENLIDLSYYFFSHHISSTTSSTSALLKSFNQSKNDRIPIWLNKSSFVYNMFCINSIYGQKALENAVIWMSQELVRMGNFTCPSNALISEFHIIHGLTLSGMPKSYAQKLYYQILRGSPDLHPKNTST